MRKSILVLSCLLLVSTFLTSCEKQVPIATKSTPTEMEVSAKTAPREETTAEVQDNLPTNDFGGRTFTIMSRTLSPDGKIEQIAVEGETGDSINDAVYRRNVKVEDRFNVKIAGMIYDEADYDAPFRKLILSGDAPFQLAAMHIIQSGVYAQSGLLMDLNKIPLLNMEKPWWNQTVKKNLSIGGKLFLAQNDIPTYTVICNNHILFFNKKLAQEYDLGNLYNFVRDGTWTIDKMRECMKDVTKDLNGDGKFDETDQWGFLASTGSTSIFLSSCEQSIMEPDEKGIPELVLNTERTVKIVEKVYDMCISSKETFLKKIDQEENFCQYFKEGRALFYNGYINNCSSLRDMENEYGLLPPPKLDETQKSYHTQIQGNSDVIGVPVTVSEEEYPFVGTITEALAAESYKIVRPAVYETALKNKYMRDTDSEEMLDLVTTNIIVDFGFVNHGWKGFGFPIWDLMESGNGDFASYYAKNEKSARKHYDSVIEDLLEISN